MNEFKKEENVTGRDINLGRFFELATTSDKIYVNEINLNDNKNEILLQDTVDFGMIRSMFLGETEQKTNIRFSNVDGFGFCNNAMEVDYDAEDVIFTGWVNKLRTPQFIMANRSQDGGGTDFKQDIVEIAGNDCYIPTSGNFFIKSFNQLTGEDFMGEFLTLIRHEKGRNNVMTSATNQPFCK